MSAAPLCGSLEEDHEGTVSIGGRTITNLHFADDIDGVAEDKDELANYRIEISAEKAKLMTTTVASTQRSE